MSELSNVEIVEKMITLFFKHREEFGCEDAEDLESQCEFEEEFAKIICEFKGHNMTPDQCGRPEHDYCVICHVRQDELDAKTD